MGNAESRIILALLPLLSSFPSLGIFGFVGHQLTFTHSHHSPLLACGEGVPVPHSTDNCFNFNAFQRTLGISRNLLQGEKAMQN